MRRSSAASVTLGSGSALSAALVRSLLVGVAGSGAASPADEQPSAAAKLVKADNTQAAALHGVGRAQVNVDCDILLLSLPDREFGGLGSNGVRARERLR